MPCYFKTPALHKGRFAMMTWGLCSNKYMYLLKLGMIFRIRGGRSSLARGLNQGVLLPPGMVVLGLQMEPVCCWPSLSFCPDLNDSLSLASSLSFWTLSWTPRRRSEVGAAPWLPGGTLWLRLLLAYPTPNSGSLSGNREPLRLSSAWARSCKGSYGWRMTDNKVTKWRNF